KTFTLLNNVAIYGGFQGDETKLAQRQPDPTRNDTILSGDLLGNDSGGSYSDNSFHVVSAIAVNETAVLDGFVITGGQADGVMGGVDEIGGGMYCKDAIPTLRNLVFAQNYAKDSGGGIYTKDCGSAGSPLSLANCSFVGNRSPYGGAMYNETSDAEFTRCTFENNRAELRGGALYVHDGYAELTRSLFRSNFAVDGGGVFVENGNSPANAVFDRCIFTENSSGKTGWIVGGGGLTVRGSNVLLRQCVLSNNRAGSIEHNAMGYGGAIFMHTAFVPGVSRVHLVNCTVCDNWGVYVGGIYLGNYQMVSAENKLRLTNCIVYGNQAEHSLINWNADPTPEEQQITPYQEGFPREPKCVYLDHSCVEGLFELLNVSGQGLGNTSGDPLYQVESFGLVAISQGSSCIDRGNNWVDVDPLTPGLQMLPSYDIFGLPRFFDGDGDGVDQVDIGAHEWHP
ncbi:MAG: hypothetical protein WBE26_00980, partial [Phycisphaerae bacterium]